MRNSAGRAATVAPLGGPASVLATLEYAYHYDDIGNRITSTDITTNRTYTANSLNQYTLISNLCASVTLCDGFFPQFDDDGNQTLIQTATGVWSVQYNGEKRPVLWTGGTPSATTNIVMSFDRMGRRVEYLETAGGSPSFATETNAYHHFLYDNYPCIQRLDAANGNTVDLTFVWDVTEAVATRPLVASFQLAIGKWNWQHSPGPLPAILRDLILLVPSLRPDRGPSSACQSKVLLI